jgi:hypothetical protein
LGAGRAFFVFNVINNKDTGAVDIRALKGLFKTPRKYAIHINRSIKNKIRAKLNRSSRPR